MMAVSEQGCIRQFECSILPRVRSTALCGQKQKEFFLKPPIITCGGSTIFMVLKTENEHAISSLNTFAKFFTPSTKLCQSFAE